MRRTDAQKLEKLLSEDLLDLQNREVLKKWVKHAKTYKEDSAILEVAYIVREFGCFIKKPFEQATGKDLEEYSKFKKEANKTVTNNRVLKIKTTTLTGYRRRINIFYQWILKHVNPKIDNDLAYYKPKLVINPRKSLEELHRIRVQALLKNRIILTNRKEDRKLKQEELNAKYSHLLLDKENLEVLNEFYTYKVASGKVLSNMGFVSKLYFIKRLGLHLKTKGKTYKEADRKDIQDFLLEVQTGLYKKSTNGDKVKINSSYKAHLLDFYRYIYGMFTEEQPRKYPDVVSWLYQKRKKSDDKVVMEVIPDKEIKQMLDACMEIRDKAVISLLADSSARVGELINIDIKDLKINEIKTDNAQYSHLVATIKLRGKTGERTNQLFYSVPYLRLWLMNHPIKDNPDAPLFIATKESRYGQRITPVGINKLLQRVAKRAGIQRHIHAHLFRHTNLTRMARYLSETELKIHAGWGIDSDMAVVYVHLNEKDVANKILSTYGIIQKEEEKQDKLFEVKICPNTLCSYQNPNEAQFCLKCGYPLTLKTAISIAKVKEKENELHKELFSRPLPITEGITDLREAMYQILKKDPNLVEKLRQIFELTKEVTQ